MTHLGESRVALRRQGVTRKSLVTPNEFVSHMIEHLAWRLGCSVDVHWTNDDWRQLGVELGQEVGRLGRVRSDAAALGMIDDGSCEVEAHAREPGGATLVASPHLDLGWFLGLRCEQLKTGQPLVSLLDGLGAGSGLSIRLNVASLEDPHHTWEGIFRAVGIVLDKMCNPRVSVDVPAPGAEGETAAFSALDRKVEHGWHIESATSEGASLRRETAESVVTVGVELGSPAVSCHLEVSDSISVGGLEGLLRELAAGGGLRIGVGFRATRLSSSHVVMEDVGLALGRTIRCMVVERMDRLGVQGAGSNVDAADVLPRLPVRVGVSVEGRKFWKFIPFQQEYPDLRRSFLIGHTLPGGLYTEDLDDFIDGFAGGLNASVIVHLSEVVAPDVGWPLVFRGLGAAIGEALTANPSRRGLTPGVKATLA